MREFHAHGAQATPDLIRALIKHNDGWARAVLSQCFSVPKEYAEALLAGEAEWTVNSPWILCINPEVGVSPSHPKQDVPAGNTPSM
jgi:hypothetical protein